MSQNIFILHNGFPIHFPLLGSDFLKDFQNTHLRLLYFLYFLQLIPNRDNFLGLGIDKNEKVPDRVIMVDILPVYSAERT